MAKSKAKKPVTLPDKPSELIRVALADLEAVERSKKYVVNMGTWHEPKGTPGGTKCEVCLAGAVMAKSLKNNPAKNLIPDEDFEDDLPGKLNALDSLRMGDVPLALGELGFDDICDSEMAYDLERSIVSYHDDPKRFKVEMQMLAYALEDESL